MTTTLPNTLADIRTKVRRITGRPSPTQISDSDIDKYINTFYVYDMPEHLKFESLRYNYEFTTTANIPTYDLPTSTYLTAMPPVYIGGYQSYMTQSRQNFFRINPALNFLQQSVYTGDGTNGSGGNYTGQFLTNLPILPGFKPNPPGAYSAWSTNGDIPAAFLNWNVLVSGKAAANATSGISPSVSVVDDGQGNLFDPTDTSIKPANKRGTINYITGALTINNFALPIIQGSPINVQYVPYVASRPQSVVFFQDQFIVYPIPDQAYTVSFEAYKYPTAFLATDTLGTSQPQLLEWWQLLAYGAADKIFADNGDLENMTKFRPLLDEQMNLCLRRTIVQQTSERVATIYTEQSQFPQYPGNSFSGF
jgi:hypothetical protein